MIYIVDGGSFLNQESSIFDKGGDVLSLLKGFIERFSPHFMAKRWTVLFVLRGFQKDEPMPRRLGFGSCSVLFSKPSEDEEGLLLEMTELSLKSDSTVVVTDNNRRGRRAEFTGAERIRCAQFAERILKLEEKAAGCVASELKLPERDVKFWSHAFGISPDMKIELKLKPDDDSANAGENDGQ